MSLTTLALAALPILAPLDDPEVDYAAILADACEAFELEPERVEFTSFDELLASERFLAVELGPFDLRLPVRDLESKGDADLAITATDYTLRTLRSWVAWAHSGDERREALLADLDLVTKWVRGWSNRKLLKAAKAEGASLFERLDAKDEVRAAGERLVEALSPRADATIKGRPAVVVFAPARETYAQLIVLAGAMEANRKDALWTSESIQGTANWSERAQIVALQFAIWPWEPRLPYRGQPMDIIHKTGLEQHVVYRAAASLTRVLFDTWASPVLEEALQTLLVVDVIGHNSSTFGIETFQWSRAGGSTQPYARFVPGAPPPGGALPKRVASAGGGGSSGSERSSWRENDGKDGFLEPLKKGQRAGAKLAARDRELAPELQKDKTAHFALRGKSKSARHRVTAPFLGDEAAEKTTPPNEYIDDFEEFFRAYRAGFMHWLRTEGHPDGPAASPEAFAELILRARTRGKDDTLSTMVLEVYGLPLSGRDGTTDSLEWRFLAHVADS